ncbi:glycosyltransferase [Corynebacterium sp. NML180780]|uniref:glycosyltransferase family protein n=1 Tax=Corynebacterium sp. NML180780 TaxID=2598459 RepID=UPI001644B5AF|nr:glycosyltransferase [Corynebacterium sp. NML180780]
MPKHTKMYIRTARSTATLVKRLILQKAPKPVIHQLRRTQKLLRTAKLKHASAGGFPSVTPGSELSTPLGKPHFPFTVGCILDEFSYAAWSPEFALVPLEPGTHVPPVDFVLVESAWAGNGGKWQFQLVGKNAPSPALREIIEQCRSRNIPTVFWNKEDPSHFEDFQSTAELFDFIATTDSNKVAEYESLFPSATAFVLPFAAQPALQNPARNGIMETAGDIAFAGTYFRHKFSNRRQQMDVILSAAHRVSQQSDATFTIFSRHAGGDSKYQFPLKWRQHVVGSLPYAEVLAAYRSFNVFLNVNSVTESPSMCARRVFEIAGSGTPVVSTESMALRNFFKVNEVPSVRAQDAELVLRALLESDLLRRRTSHLALRRVWEEHTYRHRANSLLQALGFRDEKSSPPLVSIVCSTNRDIELKHLLTQVARQTYSNIELVVVGHGVHLNPNLGKQASALGIERLTVLHRDASTSLGECLNALVQASSGEIIAKFDDDDFYLPNYLRDQVNTLINMNADLVGKGSIYFYLQGSDVIARRWKHQEHIWRNFVAGATLVGWRSVFVETPFANRTKGEDSDFLLRLERKGRRVYSADSFNYVCVRGNDKHTWQISETEILANSEIETFGKNLKHVEV